MSLKKIACHAAAAALFAASAFAGGCVSPYVAATESFGKSTSAG